MHKSFIIPPVSHGLMNKYLQYNTKLIYMAEATPKTIMRTMGVKGLTLYHLKSHLQVLSMVSALFPPI